MTQGDNLFKSISENLKYSLTKIINNDNQKQTEKKLLNKIY